MPRFYFFEEESGYYGLILEHIEHNMKDSFQLKKKLVLNIDSSLLAAVIVNLCPAQASFSIERSLSCCIEMVL